MGFRGTWQDGWVMYDGTIVVLYARPGLDGDAYYTHKSNYGLNLQVPILCLFLRMKLIYSVVTSLPGWKCPIEFMHCGLFPWIYRFCP